MKDKLRLIKNHVYTYRGRYTAIATLTMCAVVNNARVKETNEFLEKHNLLNEFYAPEDE